MSRKTRRKTVGEKDLRLQIRLAQKEAQTVIQYADKHGFSVSLAGSQIIKAGMVALGLSSSAV